MDEVVKIVGIARREFDGQNGEKVRGYSLYLTESRQGVIGEAAYNVFLSDAKFRPILDVMGSLEACVGTGVCVMWNRYGKVDRLELAQ